MLIRKNWKPGFCTKHVFQVLNYFCIAAQLNITGLIIMWVSAIDTHKHLMNLLMCLIRSTIHYMRPLKNRFTWKRIFLRRGKKHSSMRCETPIRQEFLLSINFCCMMTSYNRKTIYKWIDEPGWKKKKVWKHSINRKKLADRL